MAWVEFKDHLINLEKVHEIVKDYREITLSFAEDSTTIEFDDIDSCDLAWKVLLLLTKSQQAVR